MGDPIEEYEEGVQCTNCWGPGKTFGDYPTPKRVYITASGFAGACAVCNGKFIATQEVGFPCTWSFDNGTVEGFWRCDFVSTLFSIGISGGANCYQRVGAICTKISTFGPAKIVIS